MSKIINILPKRKWVWGLWFLSILLIFALASCGPTKLTITHAHLKPHGSPATPALINPNTTLAVWENEIKPILKTKLQESVYGFLPQNSSTQIISQTTLTNAAYGGLAQIEEYILQAQAVFDGQANKTTSFKMVVVSPNNVPAPYPVILMESFCPNNNTVLHEAVSPPMNSEYSCDGNAVMNTVMLNIFGRYIATPPMEMILKRGYAFATIFPSDYVPDRKSAGLEALARLSNGHADNDTRWGGHCSLGMGVFPYDRRFTRRISGLIKRDGSPMAIQDTQKQPLLRAHLTRVLGLSSPINRAQAALP